MKEATCEHCSRAFPLNEMFSVLGESLCQACAEREVEQLQAGQRKLPEDAVFQQVDPTICSKCQRDNGSMDFKLVVGLPLCRECYLNVSVPFPVWVKIAFAVVLGLCVVSFVRNLRFFRAYLETSQSGRAFAEGKVEEAHALMSSAADRVPEAEDLRAVASFYRAAILMREDKPREALPLLRKLKKTFPPGGMVDYLLLTAEAGIAFDDKDYDRFLKKSEAILKLARHEPMSVALVASAYACKYAVTGQDAFREKSLRYLATALKKAGDEDEFIKEYAERIRHRLRTREILSPEEYPSQSDGGSIKGGTGE